MELSEIIKRRHSNDSNHLDFIFSDENKIIVRAPAGYGKTTAMVSKIAWELCENKIPANKKILALTFSVNAALNIKDSLKKLLPELVNNNELLISKVDVANYHNFSMKLLFKYGYAINNEFRNLNSFMIVDDNHEIIKSYITKSEIIKINNFSKALKTANYQKISYLINDYWIISNTKLIPNHIITYNGILVSALKLLNNRQISYFYKKYYKMIIVDEFQDTNILGYWLINKLIDEDNINIFLGDELQKIYGFLGAIGGLFDKYKKNYKIKEVEFKNNYRFKDNKCMLKLDKFIRFYGNNYFPAQFETSINLKCLDNNQEEINFISEGIKKIISCSNDRVAILLRSASQGREIAEKLSSESINYVNVLFNDLDEEVLKFYEITISEFHNACQSISKGIRKQLQKCLESVKQRLEEICYKSEKNYIYTTLYKLLEILFNEANTWNMSAKEKYENIEFILSSNGLKHMMEFIDDRVILTTIHASKGLEWEYVIIPFINSYTFPTTYTCKHCRIVNGLSEKENRCKFLFNPLMKKGFKDEISVFYVSITRARKNVFFTVNTGLNPRNYHRKISCFLNLPGLICVDYEWDKVIDN